MGVEVKYRGRINRDKNAVLNMERIVKSLLENGSVPEMFLNGHKTSQPSI